MESIKPATSVEYILKEAQTTVYKTDKRGVFTEVNSLLAEASGYSKHELIANNQDILRHGDIPPIVYQDISKTLEDGYPWSGVLKHKRKDGGFFWANTNITPFYKDGKVTEYMYIGTAATKQQITKAQDFYKALNSNKAKINKGARYRPIGLVKQALFGRLKLSHKLLSVAVSVMLISGILLNILLNQFEDSERLEREISGLAYITKIKTLLEHVPKHRGLSQAYLKGNPEVGPQIKSQKEAVEKILQSLASHGTHAQNIMGTQAQLGQIQNAWRKLESKNFSMSPTQSFKSHTALISQILDWIFQLTIDSQLQVDDVSETNFLITVLSRDIPALTEKMGQARGLGAGVIASQTISLQQASKLNELETYATVSFDNINRSIEQINRRAPKLKSTLNKKSTEARQATERFLQQVERLKSGELNFSSSIDFFNVGSMAISANMALFDLSADIVNNNLTLRLQHTNQSIYWSLVANGAIILLAILIIITISRSLFKTINQATQHTKSISEGNFNNQFHITSSDELGSMLYALKSMQIRQGFEVTDAKIRADETLRIKNALDACNANVMLADNNQNIVYMNRAVEQLFIRIESEIQAALPNFNANALIGANMNIFEAPANNQPNIFSSDGETQQTEIKIGVRTFKVITTPVFNPEGAKLGTTIEWDDLTEEVLIQQELDNLIAKANEGDLNNRISIEGKGGFFKQLSQGLNTLLDSTSNFIDDIDHLFEAMAEGDLSKTIDKDYRGKFEHIKTNANNGIGQLTKVLSDINQISDSVNTSASEVATGSIDLSSRTESQASSLEQTAASMEQMAATIKNMSDNSYSADQLAIEAKLKAESGGQVVEQAVAAMNEILIASHKINDIIGVIDEIAFQTNLLALNASVEAARAGQQGRGFAVVASEVGLLSQRSATAAGEIKDLIRDSVTKIESGAKLVNHSGTTLKEILSAVENVASIINQVSTAAREQSLGVNQINQAISQMDEMTQQNASLVEETSNATNVLSGEAASMSEMVEFFKLPNQQIR